VAESPSQAGKRHQWRRRIAGPGGYFALRLDKRLCAENFLCPPAERLVLEGQAIDLMTANKYR